MPTHIQRVLNVDDNEMDRCVHERKIQSHDSAIEVHDAVDGRVAFDVLEAGDFWPDLILLDVNMPVLDGFEFLDLCKETYGDKSPSVVLMLSSMFQDRDIDRMPDYPMIVGTMVKPLIADWYPAISAMLAERA
ncbi:MAG: response regulator [Gammaproteobacteria bacterium]